MKKAPWPDRLWGSLSLLLPRVITKVILGVSEPLGFFFLALDAYPVNVGAHGGKEAIVVVGGLAHGDDGDGGSSKDGDGPILGGEVGG